MNRRAFLIGLASTAVATGTMPSIPASIPTTPNAELWYKAWAADVAPIFDEMFTNLVVYGTCASVTTDDYPYIKSVSPAEIYQQA